MKLILGTAEFGPRPYGTATEPVSLNDIRMIMNAAKRGGISILEGAEAYNCDEILQDLCFDLIYKTTNPYSLNRILDRTKRDGLMGLLYHHGFETQAQDLHPDKRVAYLGSSVYTKGQLTGREDMVEVPLNHGNKEFEKLTAPCKIVRSVFGRGALLQEGYTIKQCLDYVKGLTNVHGVIIGVNSVREINEVLEAWNQ